MKPTLAIRSFLLGSTILAATTSLHAAPYYWNTTTTSSWTDTTKWSDNATSGGTTGTVPGSGDTAVFNQSSVNGAEIITLSGATAIGGITFNNTGTTIIRSDTAGTNRVLTIGAGGITMASGAGQADIGFPGTAPQPTVSVTLGASQEWKNQSSAILFVRNGGNLGAHTLTLTTTGSGSINFSGAVTGTGSIIVSANSVAAMSSNASTYSGTTTINSGGILTINALTHYNANSGLGNKSTNAASNLVIDGGTLRVQVSATDSDRLFTMGAGGATFEAINTGSNSGQIKLTNTAAITYTGVGNRSLTLGGVSDDANGSSFALDIDDVGGGNGIVSLVKSGTHAWTVSGATNSYSGGTTVNAGTLTMGSGSALGSTSGSLTVNTGGTLNMAANSLTVGNLTGTGGTISGTSGTRLLTIGQGDGTGGNFQGSIDNGAGGTTALTKTGNGAITLSGTNGYTGATIVDGGKLSIGSTGTINSTSGVTIGTASTAATTEFNYNSSTALTQAVSFASGSTGGTLSGTGTIDLAVNVTTGNTLSIGNSVGVMNFSNNLEIGGTYLYELNNTDNTADLGDVAGNLTLGGILDLVQLGAYTVGDKFTLFAYDGTLSGLFKDSGGITSILDDTDFTDAGGLWTLNYDDTTAGLNGGVSASNTYVTITAIPEPRAALLGGLGIFMLLRRRR